jgi:hypothetical protein
VLVVIAFSPSCAFAVTKGQKDDFENGTTQSWRVGSRGTGGGSPVNVATGGPGGASDNYMRLTSTGSFGALSKLVVFNDSQWTGPYDSTVAGVSMQLANFGATALKMRIALQDNSFNTYVSKAFDLAPDGQWRTASWVLNTADFTSPTGGNINTGRNGIREVRILHSVGGSGLTGDPIAATVGVDNITATAVPEPGVAGLAAVGMLAALGRRRRLADITRSQAKPTPS